ncbi:MAG TPA: flagellin [Fibrobacteria bacterium]|nr:flagellin [Fibrobacteria bacterium]
MSRINHNISAMITGGSLRQNNDGLSKSLERLSTGLRINRAADDVAGLSVSEKIRTQVRGTAIAMRNAGDGIALMNIAEGACNEVSSILQRMRELAIQADNDTFSTIERSYLDQEFQSLMSEIQRIAQSTQYNGMTLMDGGPGSFGVIGGNNSILHIGANFNGGNVLGTVDTLPVAIQPITLGALSLPQGLMSITSRTAAFTAIGAVDNAIRSVSTVRSNLGAVINRLDHAVKNLEIQETNMTSAESAIRDVDFAKEMTEFTRNQILTQSATSMLSQANQAPQRVLELLK